MDLRPTAAGDLPALHEVFVDAVGELHRRHGFAAPGAPLPIFELLQAHVMATGASMVAVDGDRPVAFGSAWWRGDDWFLASLFVAPGAQGRGLGTALLEAVWGDGFARRRTITDAFQPVSNALYAGRGLVPAVPVLDFAGAPVGAEPGTLEAGEGDPAPIDALAYGFDRAPDHELWSGAAPRTVWHRKGRPVAYSYRLGAAIGPVAGIDAAAAAAALAAELARAREPVRVRIPGSARRLVEVALRHGLRLSPTPGLLLLSEQARPPDALALAGYTLY